MTVNAFLREPIRRLGGYYLVNVAVNGKPEELLPGFEGAVTVLPVPIERKMSPLRDLSALFQMISLFRRHDFQIVHSVTPKAGLLAMMAAFFAGVEIRIHTFTGQVWATRSGLSRWLLKNLDRLIGLMATHLLVDSASQRRFLLDEGVISAEKSSVLAKGSISGVDIIRFKSNPVARSRIRGELQIKDGDTVFLFLGRLNRDKGLLDLASAFAEAAKGCARIRLLVVGPDEENLLPEIVRLAGDGVSGVHFVGHSNQPEEYMAAADVLCLPSYREGFGNVIIEAAAVGIPAIGSRIYGIVDAIVENQTGLLFEAGNVLELQSCISALAKSPERREYLGKHARERVLSDFTSEALASAWLAYYRTLL